MNEERRSCTEIRQQYLKRLKNGTKGGNNLFLKLKKKIDKTKGGIDRGSISINQCEGYAKSNEQIGEARFNSSNHITKLQGGGLITS
jgi:hypothetical protein